jgi:hypothetical protein
MDAVRLELVRRLLAGARATYELAQSPGSGTTGQLCHHLRTASRGWSCNVGAATTLCPRAG